MLCCVIRVWASLGSRVATRGPTGLLGTRRCCHSSRETLLLKRNYFCPLCPTLSHMTRMSCHFFSSRTHILRASASLPRAHPPPAGPRWWPFLFQAFSSDDFCFCKKSAKPLRRLSNELASIWARFIAAARCHRNARLSIGRRARWRRPQTKCCSFWGSATAHSTNGGAKNVSTCRVHRLGSRSDVRRGAHWRSSWSRTA